MRPVTERFLSALRGPHVMVSTVDLYFPGSDVPVSVPIEGGTVTMDRTAVVRRTGQVQIPWALEAGVDLGVDLRTLPFGGMAVIRRGIRYADDTAELVTLGTFRIESVAWSTVEASAGLELADRMAQVRDEPFVTPYAPATVAAPIILAAMLVDESPVMTVPTTAGLLPGMTVTGTGIPVYGRTIKSVDSATQVTLSGPANLSGQKDALFTNGQTVVKGIDFAYELSPGLIVTGVAPISPEDAVSIVPGGRIVSVDSDEQVTFQNGTAAWGQNGPTDVAGRFFYDHPPLPIELTFGGGKRIAAVAVDIAREVFGESIPYRVLHDPPIIVTDVYFTQNRAESLFALAKAAAGECYFDADGSFVFDVPSGGTPPAYAIDSGASGVMVNADEALDRTGVYNGVLVIGQQTADTPPVTALVVNDDPASATRWGGPFGKVARVEENTAVQDAQQAADAAAALLERRIGLQRSLTLTAAPNPALEPGDVVTVHFPDGRDETHVLDVIRLSLGPVESQELATRTTTYTPIPLPARGRRVHPYKKGRRLFIGQKAVGAALRP